MFLHEKKERKYLFREIFTEKFIHCLKIVNIQIEIIRIERIPYNIEIYLIFYFGYLYILQVIFLIHGSCYTWI